MFFSKQFNNLAIVVSVTLTQIFNYHLCQLKKETTHVKFYWVLAFQRSYSYTLHMALKKSVID